MRYRPLGSSGIEASVVGFGAWAVGGWFWGGADDKQSMRAIHAAIDEGVNLIDTAPGYGLGHSEEVVGKAVRDRREKVLLATKCGLVWHVERGSYHLEQDGRSVHKYLGAESIRYEIEQSMRRLQTDVIDLYQTHWPDETTPIEETMEVLLELKREGKIRAIGVSNASIDQMDEYRLLGSVDTDQEKYSMLARRLDSAQLPYCERNGIAVLAYSPLEQGLLSGKVSVERRLAPGDLRADNPGFAPEKREEILGLLEVLRPMAEARGITLAQLAIAWTVSQPGLTHALVGARDPVQASENAAAGDIKLSESEVLTIEKALSEGGWTR